MMQRSLTLYGIHTMDHPGTVQFFSDVGHPTSRLAQLAQTLRVDLLARVKEPGRIFRLELPINFTEQISQTNQKMSKISLLKPSR